MIANCYSDIFTYLHFILLSSLMQFKFCMPGFYLITLQFRGNIRHHERRDLMGKEHALYQLMDIRMNEVMNGIVSNDGEYQSIIRKSDEYSGRLDEMDLSKEVRLLIDRYVSEQNAHSTLCY